MEEFTLEVQRKMEGGSRASRRYRKAGLLPSVVYSHGEEGVPILLDYNRFLQLAKKARSSQIFTFKSEDAGLDGRTVLVKDLNQNHLEDLVLHVDFQALKEGEEVSVDVTLDIVGQPVGVKLNGGILTVVTHEITVRCQPKQIPTSIQVDISHLDVGDSLHASDVPLSEGLTLESKADETIASVVMPRMADEGSASAAGGEGAGEVKTEEKKEGSAS
ncbi:MAG: 50S ribosomal protein L25 [Bdellovibrionales bacterium]|nr:50S ribosomal protein L25 [Bdellovibrionales bacterium]